MSQSERNDKINPLLTDRKHHSFGTSMEEDEVSRARPEVEPYASGMLRRA